MEQTHTPAFRPAYMKKTALALCYFPDAKPHTARQHLMRWIKSCPSLMHELKALGYRNGQHFFTVSQVSLITSYLSDP